MQNVRLQKNSVLGIFPDHFRHTLSFSALGAVHCKGLGGAAEVHSGSPQFPNCETPKSNFFLEEYLIFFLAEVFWLRGTKKN